ncbi:pirin family protein [Terriglobus roseus]|uniref:Pirin-related protein n=1 Tax=Terriglobus roseus TaxID=392734 RepID=A0A1H4K8D2_9BACT|nr:pirin family protein [Terriglobus roseus]SEB54683.1 hypothetical protein SAMN05443244_1059 [Terriglobus roseus]
MNVILESRRVVRIDSPSVQGGMNDKHRVRPLISPGNWVETDPFLLLMEDWFPKGVFDPHPHRGMETVTYVLEGRIEHYDNHGHMGTIAAGDAMWMTAGKGVIHNEQPVDGQTVHALQLWINLRSEEKQVSAHLQTLHAVAMPVRKEPGVEARVFSGRSGTTEAPTTNHTPVMMVELRLGPDAEIQHEIPPGFNAFVVLLEGNARVCSPTVNVRAGQIAWFTQSENVSAAFLSADDHGLRALLFAGKPLREPVAARGPFVMSTEEELLVGFRDYRSQGEQFGL